MRTYTFFTFILTTLLVCFRPANAQDNPEIPEPVLDRVDCLYEGPCFSAFYEQILESEDPNTLTILLSIIPVADGDCSETEFLAIKAIGGDDEYIRTIEQLNEDPNVVLVVNREEFLAAPQVGIVNFDSVEVEGVLIPFPTRLITIDANVDTEEPCVPIDPLPVELISFEGKATAGTIALEWSTASEKDNSHFEVERSADGTTFEPIGTVQGNGNSSVLLRYSYTDAAPDGGVNYYRLKQVDYDGKFDLSKVIAVETNAAPNGFSVQVAPNPCPNGNCDLLIRNPDKFTVTQLQLKDLSGRVVYTRTIEHESNQILQLPLQELTMHKGLFILTATAGDKVIHKRVVLR